MIFIMNDVIIESVPNFSEGRRPEVVHSIRDAMAITPGVKVLNVDIGYDANRTVFTIAGPPDQVCEALFKGAEAAVHLIDMRLHEGNHPRMGALDVCPLIPIKGISYEELIPYAEQLGRRLGEDLSIPVFYYEKSARYPHKSNLAEIRRGEYEGMGRKMTDPLWNSDNGLVFNAVTGTTALGVRPFLIAYNVNLESEDVAVAKKIALHIRASGYIDSAGTRVPGKLEGVKAIGWWMEEYQCAQVSTNIVDITQANPGSVFLAVREEAARFGIEVKSSELIGLLPLATLYQTARSLSLNDADEKSLVRSVENALGLADKESFILEDRIIEYLMS